MWKSVILLLVLIAVAVGLTLYKASSKKIEPPFSPSPKTETQPSSVEIIAKNLEVPWALTFLPDGNILVTERVGRVRLIKQNRLEEKEVATIQVKQNSESGLHGIAVHPKYSENHYVYVYYTYSAGGDNSFNRVSKFTFDKQSLKDEQIIVDKIPGAIFHDGGRIKFGPDGYLYITTGDAQNPSLAQDKNSLAGKILRVTDEGKPAPGNPFNTLVYSYGHRNPQGIVWDNQGNLWETEHGQSATDEVNAVKQGKNYGWPIIRGEQTQTGMETPILQSGSDTWAPGGAAFYQGSIYFGGLRGQALFEYVIDSRELKTHFKGEVGRIRDVVLGPDNILYITTSNRDRRGNPSPEDDRIIKIDPKKLE